MRVIGFATARSPNGSTAVTFADRESRAVRDFRDLGVLHAAARASRVSLCSARPRERHDEDTARRRAASAAHRVDTQCRIVHGWALRIVRTQSNERARARTEGDGA